MSEWALPKSVETQSIEGTGGGFAWESGVYDATVKMVYLNQAASEAQSFNIILENSEGRELREAFWIRSGKTKGKKVYYDKDGKIYWEGIYKDDVLVEETSFIGSKGPFRLN